MKFFRLFFVFFSFFLGISINSVAAESEVLAEGEEAFTVSEISIDEGIQKALKEGKEIGIIGNWPQNPLNNAHYSKDQSFISLNQAHNVIFDYVNKTDLDSTEYMAVIIAKDQMSLATKSFIEKLLSNGSTVYFERDTIDPQELADLLEYDIFIEDEFVEEESSATEELVYVFQDEFGELHFGVHLLNKDTSYNHLLDAIIFESQTKKTKKPNDLSATAVTTSSSTSSRSLGRHWYRVYGPLYYTATSVYGNLNERKEGFALDTRYDQDSIYDYAALHSRMELVPKGVTSYAYSAKFFSNGNKEPTQSGRQVYEYGPHPNPSSSTVTYNLGLSKEGLGFDVSWAFPLDNLTVLGNSDIGRNWVEIHYDYRNSAYARGTSVQYPYVTYSVWQGQRVNQITISNTKNASFVAGVIRSTAEIAHNTPIPLKKQ